MVNFNDLGLNGDAVKRATVVINYTQSTVYVEKRGKLPEKVKRKNPGMRIKIINSDMEQNLRQENEFLKLSRR
jgi:uncharacterized membrane protein